MTAWAHLPNAKHIDRVLADVRQHHERWAAAPDATRDDAWLAAWAAAWGATQAAAREVTRDVVWGVAWDTARATARDTARYAIAALIAWDDCAHLLDQPVDAVRLLAACGHHPAILLLPAVMAFAKD